MDRLFNHRHLVVFNIQVGVEAVLYERDLDVGFTIRDIEYFKVCVSRMIHKSAEQAASFNEQCDPQAKPAVIEYFG